MLRQLIRPRADFVIAVVALLALAAPAMAGDSIQLKTPRANSDVLTDIQIVDLTRDKVIYFNLRGASSTSSEDRSNVVRVNVDYAGHQRPSEFRRGKDAMDQARWADAISYFVRALSAAPQGDERQKIVRHLSMFHLVECGASLGTGTSSEGTGWAVTMKYAQTLEQEFAQSYYIVDALEFMGMAQQAQNRLDDAEATYRRLSRIDSARGTFRLALILFQQRKYPAAKDQFAAAKSTADSRGDNTTAERCHLFVGKCALQMADWGTAKDIFQSLTGDGGSDQPNVLGGAYLGLGTCMAREGEFKKAFMAFARTATVFKANVSPDELKEALGLCAQTAAELAKTDSAWQSRAENLRGEYQRRYPRQPLPDLPR